MSNGDDRQQGKKRRELIRNYFYVFIRIYYVFVGETSPRPATERTRLVCVPRTNFSYPVAAGQKLALLSEGVLLGRKEWSLITHVHKS